MNAPTICRHEPFEGRCVHCGIPFVMGAPISLSPSADEWASLERWLDEWANGYPDRMISVRAVKHMIAKLTPSVRAEAVETQRTGR